MRILFITNGIGRFDGSSKQLALIINGLAHRNHACFLYIFNNYKCEQLLEQNVTYIPEPNPCKNKLKQWSIIPFRIRKIVKKYQIDIVIGWRTNGGCYAVLSTWGLPAKSILCERSDPYMENPGFIHKIVGKIAGMASGGIFQTEKAQQFYTRLSSKAIILPNPYTPKSTNGQVLPWKNRNKTIVYFGRLDIWQKRLDLMLKAFAIIHEKRPDYRLIIYGSGKDREKLLEIANNLSISDCFVISEPVVDVINKMKQAKVMLLCSDFEGIPNVVLDALDAGLPVVTTDCSPGGMHILVKNGENGYIVPFRDFQGLAQKTLELLDNEEIAETFILNGKKKIRDFTPQRIIDQWDIYLKKINQST